MTFANDFQKLNNHLAFTSANIVAEMMLPVLLPHNIHFFYYHREYTDGTLVTMSSHGAWTRHAFQKGFIVKKGERIASEFLCKPVNHVLWLQHMWPEKVIDAAIHFDIANVMDLSIRNENYVDYFGYGARMRDQNIFNYYLSHLDSLENISRKFLVHADALITDYEKDKIIPVANKPVNSGNNLSVTLSTRQQQCAYLLMQGKSYREIACKLQLSPRTVETHIGIMKEKLSCVNKYELILKLQWLNNGALLPTNLADNLQ